MRTYSLYCQILCTTGAQNLCVAMTWPASAQTKEINRIDLMPWQIISLLRGPLPLNQEYINIKGHYQTVSQHDCKKNAYIMFVSLKSCVWGLREQSVKTAPTETMGGWSCHWMWGTKGQGVKVRQTDNKMTHADKRRLLKTGFPWGWRRRDAWRP